MLAEDARGAEPKVSPVACWGQAELEASFRPEPSGSAEIEPADPGTVSEVCFYRPSAPRVFVRRHRRRRRPLAHLTRAHQHTSPPP